MRKFAIVLGLILSLFIAGSAMADQSSEDMLKVVAQILPNIAVDAGPDIRLAALQTGSVAGDLPFRIDANTQWILLTVYASNLYKGNDPNSVYIIGLDSAVPAEISVVGGNPVPYPASFVEPVDVFSGFLGYCTEDIAIENGDNGHFSQDLSIALSWLNEDPELPMGDYSGWVKLIGAVLPGGPDNGATSN